ncbi:MAG: hypothetical protein ED554_13220 [Synechococcus sp. YX04-3]|nr:MAG: hypothetical protein ED554_13220 [Synechococcus sp. YX04-3]
MKVLPLLLRVLFFQGACVQAHSGGTDRYGCHVGHCHNNCDKPDPPQYCSRDRDTNWTPGSSKKRMKNKY